MGKNITWKTTVFFFFLQLFLQMDIRQKKYNVCGTTRSILLRVILFISVHYIVFVFTGQILHHNSSD